MPPAERQALERLRATIRAVAPEAEEVITYSMPGFRQGGVLVSYCAFKTHLSFFPMNGTLLDALGSAVEPFRTSRGTLQFTIENPLPEALVRRIVAARLEQNLAKQAARKREVR